MTVKSQDVRGSTYSDDFVENVIRVARERTQNKETISAYGGFLAAGPTPRSEYSFGNSAPIGLSGFATSSFLTGLCNCFPGKTSSGTMTVAIGVAAFYGGLLQIICSIFELIANNTFGAFAAGSYGAYWISWAVIQLPGLGIKQSYLVDEDFRTAYGLYMLSWTIVTAMIFICTFKSTVAMVLLYLMLLLTYILLTVEQFIPNERIQIASGVTGVITGVLAWYNAFAGVATPANSYVTVSPVYLPGGRAEMMKTEQEVVGSPSLPHSTVSGYSRKDEYSG